MTSVRNIVDAVGRKRLVETIVQNIASRSLTPELRDLCQEIYSILLTYDAERLSDIYEHGEMRFFIARIAMNQYRSSTSPFHTLYRKYNLNAKPLNDE